MRLGELLSKDVVTEDGEQLGKVHDVRLRLDDDGSQPQSVSIQGLIVGTGSLAARLGYTYGDVHGPRLVAAVMRRLGRSARYIPWEHITSIEPDHLRVRGGADEFGHPAVSDAEQ